MIELNGAADFTRHYLVGGDVYAETIAALSAAVAAEPVAALAGA